MQPQDPQSIQTPQPTLAQPQQFTASTAVTVKKKSKLPLILTILLILVLLGAGGFSGFMYKTTADKLAATEKNLSDTNASLTETKSKLSETQTKLDTETAAKNFSSKYNDAQLSRNLCNGRPLGMFDVHTNDKFVVFRYLCANSSQPIQIAAFAKHANGSTDFTYGSTPQAPNNLPSYIYDSEPTFFGPVYGAKRF